MRSVSALFDLRNQVDAGELDLSTPLGTLIGKVQWSPQQVSLLTHQGLRSYPNLSALSEDVLGENIPLQALFDWLNGRPWSGAQATPLPGPPNAGFTQLGWRIQLDQLAQGIIKAHREAAPEVFFHARLLR
jgi:outer membrane lipoprotein LolB